MSISRECFSKIAEAILSTEAKRATKYFSPREVVKGTLIGKRDARYPTKHILFTIGRPNYEERKFIKLALKAGEHFPIKRLILKYARSK